VIAFPSKWKETIRTLTNVFHRDFSRESRTIWNEAWHGCKQSDNHSSALAFASPVRLHPCKTCMHHKPGRELHVRPPSIDTLMRMHYVVLQYDAENRPMGNLEFAKL
jgi:hypothetical protein